jgi:hypothetical protein
MTDQRITLPRPEKALLIKVRSGAWKLDKVLTEAKRLVRKVEEAVSTSPLPERVDRTAISKLLAQVHLGFWSKRSP